MARVGKKNKTKFVLRKELIILVFILLAMIVTTICLSIPSKDEKRLEEFNQAISSYNTANSTQYNLLDDQMVFQKANLKGIEKAIDNSKGTESEPKYTYVLYGSLSNATILENLSAINTEAKNREVKKVYFYASDKVDGQEDLNDADFLAEIEQDETVFNKDVLNGVDKVDLLKPTALYVYKNGELVFNSMKATEDETYSWSLIINQAFSK